MTAFLSASLFDRTGQTRLYQLSFSFDKQFVDELRGDGSFSLSIPLEESASVEIGRIVKFSYGESSEDYVFAGVIEQIRRVHTDQSDIVRISGRGVRALLEGAIVDISDRSYTSKTVGYIMKELFDEAVARNALDGLSITFNNTTDSDGAAFTSEHTVTIEEKLGTNLNEIAGRHQELAVDVWVKPDMTVNYYLERGTDRTTGNNPLVLRVGESVVNYERTEEGPIRNYLLAVYSSDSIIRDDERAGSIAANGRQESFLSLTNIQDSLTADKSIARTLDNLETTTVGATLELAEAGPQPYIDFEIGDWVVVADEDGNRENFRVRAVTMSEQEVGAVRIIPELGNAKAALEERLRRLIARQEAKTASGAADATAASVDLNGVGVLAGGGTLEDAIILTYDPATGTGTADAPAIDPIDPITFTNATGQYLFTDDEVLIATVDHDNNPATPDIFVALGITERAGTIVPVQNPSGVIPPDFPFRSDTGFTYPINGGGNNSSVEQVNDMAGLLGFGTDLIVGPATSSAGVTNALNRGTTNSYQLSGSVGALRYYLLSDGKLITTNGSSTALWRNPSTGVWTTMFTTTSTGHRHVFDHSTGIFWSFAHSNTGGPFFKFGPGDAAPVALGSLGTGIPNTATQAFLTADNGWLVLRPGVTSPFTIWRKSSSDTSNFTSTGTTTNAIDRNWHVGPDGRVHNVSIVSGSFWISSYDPSNGSSSSVNTGISTATRPSAQWVKAISPTVFAIFCNEFFTPAYNSQVWTFNGTTNALIWQSPFTNAQLGAAAQTSMPVRTSGTTWRWSQYQDTSPARTWQMELTFV